MNANKKSAFSLQVSDNGIGWITIDVPGESQNTLRGEFVDEITALFDEIESNSGIKALILTSGKDDNFVAGADIAMLESIKTAQEATELALTGHKVFSRLENMNMPVVAAIHGACLGGGLELTLACSHRVCTDDRSTKLGLPEVQLGVLPGGGGTQRLPRLVGIASALDMMLTGRQLVAKQAKKLGLVDEVVPLANLRKAAEKIAIRQIGRKRRKISELKLELKPSSLLKLPELQKLVLETSSFGRNIIFDKALQTVNKKTHGNYPSPPKIIECVKVGMEEGFEAGMATEAKLFGELVVSPESEQLMNIFFATTELKKDSGVESDAKPQNIARVGVLGGGLMGAGIAFVTADKAGKPVRIKDMNSEGINHALKYCWEIYRKRIKRKRISINHASKRFAAISGTTDYSGFKRVNLVVEAVFEDLDLKQKMVKEIEENCHEDVIFATNTSSIPISDIASASQRPERVVGLHYFSPVDKMPLLEIIKSDKTSDEVIATCVEFGRQQGKTVIVVRDGAGFYVNRILAPYMNEAGQLVAESVAVDRLDKALVNAGFPVGPMTLLDEVGIDVATKVAPILEEAFGSRMAPPAMFDKLKSDDRKGRKNGRGFYRYDVKGSKPVDESIYLALGIQPGNTMDDSTIVQRCLLMMVNEAVRCLEDGIIRNVRDGDIGAIFGIGFPPFLGGPFRYIDSIGAQEIVKQMEMLEKIHGERFKPAQLLVEKAEAGEKFYPSKD
ncbi:fatty acid oxidation complex subunit alpha FadJ [Aliikangiella coralliicola]|uniref:enoyl-CoA hydratase n=1 Tax=Aliikangiella coralliicola TaxID=2592383 RepID=A0A545UAJ0_9GAMM|nr:fatty acid oxidation complex subunit alpha FadJ [Aliikangiella coralliicola]TQV86484.1 fatty acid oxidation complex subunit alpha FadJ [Aliikangiella coralliicola]